MENEPPVTNMERKANISGQYRIIKNLVVMSLSLMLVFTAYDGLSMLQSTMNKQIGTVSLAVVYAGFCLSSLVLPKYAIKKLGCKVIFLIAVTLFVPYVAANFYPSWGTLVPTGLLMGVGSSLIWAAQTSYFNESAALYCFLDGFKPESKCNPHPTAICDEKLPNNNYYSRSVEVVSGNNSNFTSVEVLSSSEVLSEGNSNCIKVLAEINPNCASEEDFPEITPQTDNFEEYSNKTTVLLTDKEFESTEDLVINDKDNDFLVINSKLQNEQLLSVTNPCFSGDVSKKFDCKTHKDSSSSGKTHRNHVSEIVNHKSMDFSYSTRMKFKGEIASDVKDVRSRHLNKNKIIVSVISNVHETDIPNTPTCEIETRVRIPNVENHNRTTNDIHDRIDVQYACSNPRKSLGYINVLRKFANIESVTARFFGSNGLAFHSAQIWSSLVSYYILQSDNSTEESPCLCGASFCSTTPGCVVESSEEKSDDMRYLLTGIFVALSVLAVFLALFFLDPLGTEKEPVKFSLCTLMATLQHCRQRIQLCLVPTSLYVGMIQGFYTADFTKSYIACALGKSKVGLITIYYGLSCALSSTMSGYLVKYTGRIPIFLLMQLVNIAAMVFLLVWSPDPARQSMFYVTAVLLGMVTGILWSQMPAFYGILFKKDEEAAFASYYLFNSLGWMLSFTYSEYLCTSVKIYILLLVSSVGIFGYLGAEGMHRARKDKIGLSFA